LKNSILMGIVIAFILLLSSSDTALAEKGNATMSAKMAMQDNMTASTTQDNAIMQNNMTMPQKMSMPMSMQMPMSMPMNQTKMPDGGTNVIILQNVTLNIVTILNMTFPNAIPASGIADS
jgi:hypothetical protein